jgi:hypothetical protein
MEQKTAQGWKQTYMVLFCISALCVFFLLFPYGSISSWLFFGSFLLPGVFLIYGWIPTVLTGAVGILVTLGLFWRKNLARYVAAVISVLLIVDTLFILGVEAFPFETGSVLNDTFVVFKLFFGIYLFGFNKGVKALFAKPEAKVKV